MRGFLKVPHAALMLGLLMASAMPGVARGDEKSDVEPKDEIVADKQLAGVWNLVAATNDGKKLDPQRIEGSRVIVREGRISVVDREEKERFRCSYTFDRSSEPWKIDMVAKLPGKPETVSKGIYKIEGDTWTLCYALSGKERPEEFRSPKDSGYMLMKMERPKNVDQQGTPDQESTDDER